MFATQPKCPISSAFFVLLILCSNGIGQEKPDQYVSKASFVIGTFEPKSFDANAEKRVAVTNAFLDSLSKEQRGKIQLAINDPERHEWTNLPPRPDAKGLTIGELDEKQVGLACEMMSAMFSKTGYAKMCDIMLADDQLLPGGRPSGGLGTEKFGLVIFGSPSAIDEWAFQLDGHHIGVNLTFKGDKISISPSFIGTQPEAFKIGAKDFRPLTKEIDDAYRLVNLLDDDQRKAAVLSPNRGSIVTGPGADGKIPEARGAAVSTFSKEQKEILIGLMNQWINDLPEANAKPLREEFAAQIDKAKFSWNGALTPRSDISYAIMSPDFIIEFSCQGVPHKPLDHIHTMFRTPNNEYGAAFAEKK